MDVLPRHPLQTLSLDPADSQHVSTQNIQTYLLRTSLSLSPSRANRILQDAAGRLPGSNECVWAIKWRFWRICTCADRDRCPLQRNDLALRTLIG